MLNTIILSTSLSMGALSAPQDDAPVNQIAINEAIDRGVQFLLTKQHVDGSWYDGKSNVYPNPEGGATALCVAALLHSGLDKDHQAIVRGAAYARSRPKQMYYGIVTRILMEDILGDSKDERELKALAEFLVGGSGGYYDYPGVSDHPPDLSVTQYAVLGMWMAKKNGIRIPDKAIESSLKAILREQLTDGGWSYTGAVASQPGVVQTDGRAATCSMTTAGMSSLLFCLDALGERQKTARKLKEDVEEALERGYQWLVANMSYEYNLSLGERQDHERQWDYYYYYTIERLGTVASRDELGGKNWYQEGAKALIKSQLSNGGWTPSSQEQVPGRATENSTAFALLFLNKATSSVTGKGVNRKARSVTSLEPDKAAVDLRINLTKKPSVWIAQFGRDVIDNYGKKGKFGLRVEKVSYFLNDEEIGVVAGDIEVNSGGEQFAMELDIGAGKYEVKAVVTVAPEPAPGLPVGDGRVEIESPVVQLMVDWTMTDAQRLSLEELTANLILTNKPAVSVSSENDTFGEGSNAVDGTTGTMWMPDVSDKEPSIRMSWKKSLKAKTLVLTPLQGTIVNTMVYPDGRKEVTTYLGLAKQLPTLIEVSINGKETKYELKGEAREHIDLGKTHSIKSLEIKILGTKPATPQAEKGTGFSEIELIGKVKKRR